jgi:GntR family transcriptional regulator/MocR family aminotransferase
MLRPWKFSLIEQIDPWRDTPVYLQIVQALIHDIRRGRLLPGAILPSTRAMADTLGVNRKTIVLAYDDLVAQGWLTTLGTRGTFVSETLPEPAAPTEVSRDAESANNQGRSPDYPYRVAPTPMIVYPKKRYQLFDDGVPDHRLLPAEVLAQAYRAALRRASRIGGMVYGDPMGSIELRELIADMLATHRGLVAAPENICVTRGSQMAIFLASRILLNPGDLILVEGLSYASAIDAFRATGAEVVGVKLDNYGIDVDEVAQICTRRKVRAVYVTPHHQFPTTVSLKADRRLKLIDLAARFHFAIIEDDYDHEFHYERQPLLPMASYAPNRTIYIGSTSKLLVPGLRVGYVAAAEEVVKSMANEAAIVDRQGNTLTELAVAELIKSGELRRHARKALQVYRQRRNSFALFLRKAFGELIDFNVPDGGLAFWVKFREATMLDAIEANAESLHIRFLGSRCFAVPPWGDRGLRLGFGSLNQTEAEEAIERLRAAAIGSKASRFAEAGSAWT